MYVNCYPGNSYSTKNRAKKFKLRNEILNQNTIAGSDHIRVFTPTTGNEAAAALSLDLLKNLDRSFI